MSNYFFDVSRGAVLIPAADIQEALAVANSNDDGPTVTKIIAILIEPRGSHSRLGWLWPVSLGAFGIEPHTLFSWFGPSGRGTCESVIKILDV